MKQKLDRIGGFIIDTDAIRKRDEKIHNLEYLSGKTIEELVDLFAAGWTLNPPKEYSSSFGEFLDSL